MSGWRVAARHSAPPDRKKNISEIAYDSGFENISHFSRIFKEKYSLSPLQYRKNNTSFLD
jgi:AraC-like DNA-binding protein